MIYLPTRLVQAFPKFLLAVACLAMSAFCTLRLVATKQQLIAQWTNYPPSESLLTLAVTVAILAAGALVTAWWSLGFALTYLAMITVPTSALHRTLAAGALRVAPRIARTALVGVTGASLTLTATGALAAPAEPALAQVGSLQSVSAQAESIQTLSPATAMPASPTGPVDITGTTESGGPSIYLGFGAPGSVTAPNADAATAKPPATRSAHVPAEAKAATAPPSPAPAGTTESKTGSDNKTDSEDKGGSQEAATTVTVTPGDSLWSITATLAPSATGAEIATLWPQLYLANSAAIGADPDLILPGTVLAIPTDFGSN